MLAADDARDPGVTPRRARIVHPDAMFRTARDVPPTLAHRTAGTRGDARALNTRRARIEAVRRTRCTHDDRQHDRGAERDPRTERGMDEDAEEAPPSEPGALRECHERDRIVREAERVEEASGL